MIEEKKDLRIIRTRKFIMDSFVGLLEEKDFNSITISDITSRAMVNRATFYRHFLDKYELLEIVLKEKLLGQVLEELKQNEEFNKTTLENIFISITNFHQSLSVRCQRSYEEMTQDIETILKKELEQVILQSLFKKYQKESKEQLRMIATMLSSMIYSASVDWKKNSSKSPREYLADANSSIRKFLSSELE